jgi:hypothetical protein
MTAKTVPCQFFHKGFCRNGNTCNYGHDLNVSVPAHSSRYDQSRKIQSQDFARFPQTCHFFREGRCMKGDKCPRRHEIPESSNPATDICRFFLTGKCTFGDKCRRSHTLDAAHTQIKSARENEATGAHTLSV